MNKIIIGVFKERSDVEKAIEKLRAQGLDAKDVSIVMRDHRQAEEIGDDTGVGVAGGAVSGATTGAVLGGIAGLIAGIALPGLGAFLIGGPIAAALGLGGAAASTVSGAATGAVAGGLLGALMGLGLSQEDAEHYESRVKEGAILVAAPAREGQEDNVSSILKDCNADDIKVVTQSEAKDVQQQRMHKPVHADKENHQSKMKSSRSQQEYSHAAMGAKGGRTGTTDALSNPIEVQKHLKNVDYPCSKEDLLSTAEREGADERVLNTLREMPGDSFESPKAVSQAIGKIK